MLAGVTLDTYTPTPHDVSLSSRLPLAEPENGLGTTMRREGDEPETSSVTSPAC